MVEVRFLQSSELLEELRGHMSEAKSFRLAVAFLKESGYAEIRKDFINLLEAHHTVEIVVGISSYGITDWTVLRDLLKLKEKYSNFDIKYYNHERFHPKLFIFELQGKRWSIIIGSSNLTGGGVRNNVEANVLLKGTSSEEVIADVIEFFRVVSRTAEKLKPQVISDYRQVFERSRRVERQSKRFRIKKTPLPAMPEKGVKIFERPVQPDQLRQKIFWKIAPGRGASQWPLWEREIRIDKNGAMLGIIAIGWEFDMTKLPFHDYEELKNEVKRGLEEWGFEKGRPGYVARQALFFCKKMRKGDIVVAYSKSHIHGVAQILDAKPYYHETSIDIYPNKRNVKWLTLKKWKPEEYFRRVLRYPNDTIHEITDKTTIAMLKRELTLNLGQAPDSPS